LPNGVGQYRVSANLKFQENAEEILSFFGRYYLAQKEYSRFAVSGA
jgi:hypothetical protein